MIAFTWAALALSLGSLAAMVITGRRGSWKQHRLKVFAVSCAGVILAVIGLIGVS